MTISVAIATYRGAAYIQQQLQSLVAQTIRPDEIVICDDNSPDNTVAVAKRFAETCPIPIHIHVNPKNLGVVANFERAINLCQGSYIALCDQDDVWLPQRLAVTWEAMLMQEAATPGKPMLVHSDLTVVDHSLNVLHPSFSVFMRIHHHPLLCWLPRRWHIALQNHVTGCTCLLNRPLIQMALPFPAHITMHDHWLALVAIHHGHLISLPEQLLLYRQHAHNQVGAKRKRSFKNNLHKARQAWRKVRMWQQAKTLQAPTP